MKIINGREESLDGRFIVYSVLQPKYIYLENGIVKENSREKPIKQILAKYFSNDKIALFNKFPGMKEKIELGLNNNFERIYINAHTTAPRQYIMDFLEGNYSLILGEDIILASEIFSDFTEDIVPAGNHSNFEDCNKNMTEATIEYYNKLREQAICPVNYEDFNNLSVKEFIYDRYINKMLNAKRTEDSYIFGKVKEDFMKFSEGSYFEGKTKELCKLLETVPYKKTEYVLLTDYISIIDALHKQEFHYATLLNREIKELVNAQSQNENHI